MKTALRTIAVVLVTGSLGACANWSSAEKGTAIGAGAGALVGGVVTHSPLGLIGGAAVGGVIGHEVGKDSDRRR
jgi:osmotically inducible lipoprotein OsmB